MDLHLIDGTYELFRHFFAVPAAPDVLADRAAQQRIVDAQREAEAADF